ncbi:MAG: sigma 54-interacting transcriptional regulator [Planctomycetota bacterium]
MFSLIFLSGDQPGQSFALDDGVPISLGRDPGVTLQLKHESVSRTHAILEPGERGWRIRDNGSLNGTHINSRQIDQCDLYSGDLIRIGEFMLLFADDVALGTQIDPLQLADSTRVRRILGSEKQRVANDPIGADSTSGPVRKLSFLYRLSREMYRVNDVEELCKYALRSSMDVVAASVGKVAIRGSGGRLHSFFQGDEAPTHDAAHVLSNWVIERDEAVLLDANDNVPWSAPDESVEGGTVLAVPIPSSVRPTGAIELFQPSEKNTFNGADLEFMVSVAQQLGMAIEWLQRMQRVEIANDQLRAQLKDCEVRLIGECPSIRELRSQIARVALASVTTLILGESGTGKEVASRVIHESSPRRDGPFITVNCAAFNESLLESELFGHERGAFTGADQKRLGQFERADGGTIFLDEIGEMSLSCQAKVLRLIEGQPFERVGGTNPITTDVRIVAATHRNLETMVAEKLFREDLWFRLRVVELFMPPLRQRGDDIMSLAEHFLDELGRELGVSNLEFSSDARQTMLAHPWPGNVRELRNAVERAIVLSTGTVIGVDDLGLRGGTQTQPKSSNSLPQSLAEVERRHIEHVLALTGGNKTRACEILGIPRTSLYNKLKK